MKRVFRYQFRLFITGFVCIWAVILLFAWCMYNQERKLRIENVVNRVSLINANLIDSYEEGRDVQRYLNFIHRYFDDSFLKDVSVQVYDAETNQLLYFIGKHYDAIPLKALDEPRRKLSDGSGVVRVNNVEVGEGAHKRKLFYYSSHITPDGKLNMRTFVPLTPEIRKEISIDPYLWVTMIVVGLLATALVYIVTRHQARNVSLLHDFAQRAANDRNFIPIGDFPSDEIGDISRQIISIYNSSLQANVRREREHDIALKAIEEKNRMKRAFTNNLNHELKTPIGIIRAYVDMLINQPDMSDENRRHFLMKTQLNVERLINILNDLSTMTRLEESGKEIPLKEIDFHDFMLNISEDVRATNLIGDMKFRYDIPADCRVVGNEGLLNSAFQNLIKNSVAYSQGTEMGVELLGKAPTFYTFSFYDNGVGVAEEHFPHLFDRFYRIDTGRSRKTGGTGLGLHIVKSIINTLGGSISVHQRAGGGLEFVFTLPRCRREGDAEAVSIG